MEHLPSLQSLKRVEILVSDTKPWHEACELLPIEWSVSNNVLGQKPNAPLYTILILWDFSERFGMSSN